MLNEFKLKVKKLREFGKIDSPAKEADAGYDVYSQVNVVLEPQERFNMPLGVALEFSPGWVCLVQQKSGLAKNLGIDTIGNVIDQGYRGEIHAQIVNTGKSKIKIEVGKKIAQLVFVPYGNAIVEYVEELSETQRGDTGFGSTGI